MLNKAGKRSKRNLEKPWRPVSYIEKKDGSQIERPMETIRIHRVNRDTQEIEESRMIFNGTLGSPTIDGRGGGFHVLKVGTKSTQGKSKQRKKKHSGGLVHQTISTEDIRIEQLRLKRQLNRWHKLFNWITVGFIKTKSGKKREIAHEEHLEYQSLKRILQENLGKKWENEYQRALKRRKSLLGMLRKGQL